MLKPVEPVAVLDPQLAPAQEPKPLVKSPGEELEAEITALLNKSELDFLQKVEANDATTVNFEKPSDPKKHSISLSTTPQVHPIALVTKLSLDLNSSC